MSLVDRKDHVRLQEYAFFAIIKSLRSAKLSKRSVID